MEIQKRARKDDNTADDYEILKYMFSKSAR